MIPADLASRLRNITQDLPASVQPVPVAQKVADALSELSVGQRIMAEIKTLLPNGAYRAVIAQREITLALPFSAKPGDSLELEVTEANGKLTLAFVANKTASEIDDMGSSPFSARLSKTGNLIGELLNQIDQQGGRAKPAALNANQPLITEFTGKASELLPMLKDSLIKSGMFYEAHQAQWLEGKLSTANLLQEPQGKLSTLSPPPQSYAVISPDTEESADISAHVHLSEKGTQKTAAELDITKNAALASKNPLDEAPPSPPSASSLQSSNDSFGSQRTTSIHPELTPLVQQQLNALATQTYVWQGQVWPGQNMDWEITEDDGRPRSGEDEITGNWQTRLKLSLPNLGGIEARIGLGLDGKLSVALKAEQQESLNTLRTAGSDLEKSLQASGLQLNKFIVAHGEITG